jgi:hypothetical protein
MSSRVELCKIILCKYLLSAVSHLSYISKELMRYDGVAAGFDIFERVLE